jgi:hypothetical protein
MKIEQSGTFLYNDAIQEEVHNSPIKIDCPQLTCEVAYFLATNRPFRKQ